MKDKQCYASNKRSKVLTGNSEVLDFRDLDHRVPEIKATKESVHLDYGSFHYVEYSDPKRKD